jgi:uncharacterized protein (TIGR02246 family)
MPRTESRSGTNVARGALLIAALSILTAAHSGNHGAPAVPTAPDLEAAANTESPVATVSAFHIALARGDTDAVLALMAEDALIYESGGVERGRAEYARHHLAADAAFSAAVARTLVDRRSGESGDTAWVMTVETVTGNYRGRAINSRSVETMLLRRIGGRWRIAHIHWSSADLPAN